MAQALSAGSHSYGSPQKIATMREYFLDILSCYFSTATATQLALVCSLVLIALMAWIAYEIWSHLVVPSVVFVTQRTRTNWDDALLNKRVLRSMGQIIPALIVSHYLPTVVASHSQQLYVWTIKLTNVYIVWAVWFLINRLAKSLYDKLIEDNHIEEHSSKGLLQMVQIIITCITAIIAVSILCGRSPGTIVTALGATSAVLMLVFKDTILGLVAGVQLSANNMLKKGDWIVVDKAGANGEVEDISLTTVKVRNWDESITTISPYVLFSESFQNYANMRELGARRVMRSLLLDANSVRFLNADELKALHADQFITDEEFANSSRSVNLQLFRHHLERMLLANENVRTDMRIMVRQLQPTAQGLPLELFFFVNITEWEAFESLQSDIFDHVYAIINHFGLRLYQRV
jgi:miniconductance mechanosensitive channel